MKKKLMVMASTMVIGGGILLTAGFVNASQISGYDAYKSAIENTHSLNSVTGRINVSLMDNGNTLLDVNSNAKLDQLTKNMSNITSITVDGKQETSSMYKQDGKQIEKSSDSNVYNVRDNKNNGERKKDIENNPQMQKKMEGVIDALVGNLKDSVVETDNSDGTKNITVKLSENEIPPVVNAAASLAANIQDNHMDGNEAKIPKEKFAGLKNDMPKLQTDIKIQSFELEAKITKDNVIEEQTGKITITGKDASGKDHIININLNADLSNFNSTKPDTINLSGKQIKTITANYEHHENK